MLIPFGLFSLVALVIVFIMPNSFWEGKLMEEIDKKNFKGYQIAIAVLSACAVVVILFYSFLSYEIHQTELEQEKPLYWHKEDTLNGIVVWREKHVRGSVCEVKLNEGTNKMIGWAENKLYLPNYELSDFVQVGDSLHKIPDTDSLLIFREGNVFNFVISQRFDEGGLRY